LPNERLEIIACTHCRSFWRSGVPAVKRAFITGATAEIGLSVAKKGASRRFATALQCVAGTVLGLLLDVAFVLFVLWGATPSRRAIEPNKSVKLDQTEFSYLSRVPTRSSGD